MENLPATYDDQKQSEPEEKVCECGEPIKSGKMCADCRAVENRRDDY